MPHHEDCYRENGGCTVFGCKCAPADDPKLQVSQSDLSALSAPAQTYGVTPQQNIAAAQTSPSMYGGPLGLSQAAATAPSPTTAPAASAYAYTPQQMPPGYQYAAQTGLGRSQKNRTTYIVLGVFLGFFGAHNFYAGYVGRAVGQLCLTVLTVGYLGLVSWIWSIIEICIVEKDSTGLNFS
jgi:TM2 domain-containing membrane protein YozV